MDLSKQKGNCMKTIVLKSKQKWIWTEYLGDTVKRIKTASPLLIIRKYFFYKKHFNTQEINLVQSKVLVADIKWITHKLQVDTIHIITSIIIHSTKLYGVFRS